MLIDFHTHFFPDKIAAATISHLAHEAGMAPAGDGTLNDLRARMKEDGVTLSVNQPVATKPEQVAGINRKMAELNEKFSDVVNFGALHPLFPGYDEEMTFLSSRGFKGIKLHPEYQSFHPDDKRFRPFFECCGKHRFIVLFHAGVDLAYTDVHCTPAGMRELLDIPGLTIVLAHMGGYRRWDDVEKYLVGKDVYFDLAYCNEMEDRQLERMIKNHGADRILFATDFPWERARVIKKKIDGLPLDPSDRENIFHKNAARLLRLPVSNSR